MKYFIALLFSFFVFSLYAQEKKAPIEQKSGVVFKELKIKFFADHVFKKVKGECIKPKVENLKVIPDVNGVSAEVPFSISCTIVNMHTGDENRDSHMWEILGYPDQKEINFSVKNLELTKKGTYSFQGDLTIKGTTKPVSFTASSKQENGSLKINATFDILLSDFKVERPSVVFTSIKDKVRIEWEAWLK
ncbi:MAG: YceI family protein [Leptospiraceae bacterium]|nr:YceI family protein [Leptospiraceae bacterium]